MFFKNMAPGRAALLSAVASLLLAVAAPALAGDPPPQLPGDLAGMPQKIRHALAAASDNPAWEQASREVILPGAEPGILGIPGAPSPPWWLAFLWAVWVGWIFSTVGAFGGVMAGVGHITIFGIGDFARAFGRGHPLNKALTDAIRVSNQWLGGIAALFATISYQRMKRLVLPVGLSLAVGAVAGAYLVPRLTAGKVNLKDYIGIFGLIVLALGAYLFYQTTPRGQKGQQRANAAAAAFQNAAKEGGAAAGVELLEGNLWGLGLALALVIAGALWGNVAGNAFPGAEVVAYALVAAGVIALLLLNRGVTRFAFSGVEFSFRGWVPALGGFVIAAIASFIGVGGGFLLVPFLTAVTELPMFLAAGTSSLAVLVSMVVSIFTYMVGKGVVVPWTLVGAELAGVAVGAMIGPRTQKYIPEVWLKRLFILLAFYVGVRYLSKGFLGYSLLPPF